MGMRNLNIKILPLRLAKHIGFILHQLEAKQ